MIAPSILNANNMHLSDNIKEAIDNGINRFHIDIMDGHFVPNLSYGPELVTDLKNEFPDTQIEIHLMSDNLKTTIPLFVKTNCCHLLEFHFEACQENEIKSWIDYLHDNQVKAGLVINPTTPVEKIKPYLPYLDQLLIMTVIPGFGGQKFRDDSSSRIKEAQTLIAQLNQSVPIEVDGGVNDQTIKIVKDAGASIFVVGSYIFKKNTISHQIDELKTILN